METLHQLRFRHGFSKLVTSRCVQAIVPTVAPADSPPRIAGLLAALKSERAYELTSRLVIVDSI